MMKEVPKKKMEANITDVLTSAKFYECQSSFKVLVSHCNMEWGPLKRECGRVCNAMSAV